MFSDTTIIAKAWLSIEVVNLVLAKDGLSVDKIFLIGSYANGNPNSRSDIDYLVQLKGYKRPGMYYPSWNQIQEIHKKLDTRRVHIIFGTLAAQESLRLKSKNTRYKYKEITQGGLYAVTHAPGVTQ